MMKLQRNWRMLIGCSVLVLVTAGCFQDINDAESQNVVSQLNTAIPTQEPPTQEPSPTEEFTDIPTETATATPSPTITPTEELDRPVSDIGGGTAIAQANDPLTEATQEEVDIWGLTATQYIASVTAQYEIAITQTALALGGPTLEPLFTATPEQPVFGITETATPGVITQPGTVCIHEVKAGENLFRLSITYGVSVAQLASASGITNINQIWVGDKINIPGCGTTGVYPPPTSVPTSPAITGQTAGTGTGVDTSAQTVPPATGGRIHVVQQYESLFQISMTYGVSVASIANANGITDINNIIMGRQLTIPSQ